MSRDRDRFPERAVIRHRDGRRGTMVHGHRFPAGQAVIEFEIGSILADQIEAIVWTQDNGIGLNLADTARPVGRA